MALTTIQTNNKKIAFSPEVIREFVRGNAFSPYMGDGITSIIRTRHELKNGGEQMNIPLVSRLTGAPSGAPDTLVGAEEQVDNYGMRVWVDWARHAVATNDAEEQKDSADLFSEFRPMLTEHHSELQRDELIAALMALPSESAPAGLGATGGQRVNGILFEASTTAQIDAWVLHNRDRVLFGNDVAHLESDSDWSDSIVKLEAGTDRCTKNSLSLMKRMAKNAQPKIRPYKTKDGYEYFVGFAGTTAFRDIKASLNTDQQQAMDRGKNNPIFQDGDVMWDGMIVREVPEIDYFVDNVWTSANADHEGFLATAGATSARVSPVFLCGQAAASIAFAKMPTPTVRKEDDYGFIKGVGYKTCYGIAKNFKKHTTVGGGATNYLKQWSVVTGFFASALDSSVTA